MKKFIGIAVILLLPAIVPAADVTPETNVHAVVDRWVKMWNTYDLLQSGPVTIVLQQGNDAAPEIVHMNFSNY